MAPLHLSDQQIHYLLSCVLYGGLAVNAKHAYCWSHGKRKLRLLLSRRILYWSKSLRIACFSNSGYFSSSNKYWRNHGWFQTAFSSVIWDIMRGSGQRYSGSFSIVIFNPIIRVFDIATSPQNLVLNRNMSIYLNVLYWIKPTGYHISTSLHDNYVENNMLISKS